MSYKKQKPTILFLGLLFFSIFLFSPHTSLAKNVNCCFFPLYKVGTLNTNKAIECAKDGTKYCQIDYRTVAESDCVYEKKTWKNYNMGAIEIKDQHYGSEFCQLKHLKKVFGDEKSPLYCCVQLKEPHNCQNYNDNCPSGYIKYNLSCAHYKFYYPNICKNYDITSQFEQTWFDPNKSTTQQVASVLSKKVDPIPFKPQLNYPGLIFGDVEISTVMSINWIAQFIIWLYKYSVGIGAVMATVLIMVGGMQYIIAGGDTNRITNAKNTIKSAFTGLSVLLGAFFILNFINPALTTLKPISIPVPAINVAAQYINCKLQEDQLKHTTNILGKNYCFDPVKGGYYNLVNNKINETNLGKKEVAEIKKDIGKNITYLVSEDSAYITVKTAKKIGEASKILTKDLGPGAQLQIIYGIASLENQVGSCDCYYRKQENIKKNATPACPSECAVFGCDYTHSLKCSDGDILKGKHIGIILKGSYKDSNGKTIKLNCGKRDQNNDCRTGKKGPNCDIQGENKLCQDKLSEIMKKAGFSAAKDFWWTFFE